MRTIAIPSFSFWRSLRLGCQAKDSASESGHPPISFLLILRLFQELLPYRRAYLGVCLLGVAIAGLEMIPPRLVGRLINDLSQGQFFTRSLGMTLLTWSGIAIAVQWQHRFQILWASGAGEKALVQIRLNLFEKLQQLPLAYFDRNGTGRILSRAANDIDALRNILVWGLNTLVSNTAILAFAALMLMGTDSGLFFSVVWLGPLMLVVNFLYAKKAGKAWQRVSVHSTRVSARQAENIAGFRVVAAFNRQGKNLAGFNALQKINTEQNIAAAGLSGAFQPLLLWIKFLGNAILLGFGSYKVSQKQLGAGELVASLLYWEWIMLPAVNFGVFLNDLMAAMASAERVFSILDEPSETAEITRLKNEFSLSGQIRFEKVSFGYLPDRRVLHDLDLEIPAGKTVALVGATGSGKSTILSLLARFYQPQYGRILLDSADLRHIPTSLLRRQMAIVLQNNFLFSGTLLDNLRYAAPKVSEEEVFEAAKALGCHERFLNLQNGYGTQVGEKGASLSLGERQLICLTRAWLTRPRFLLLDEATSAVDPTTEHVLQRALFMVAAQQTTVIVAHRFTTVTRADQIVVLDQGRIVERGSHAELLKNQGKYWRLFTRSA